MHTYRSGLPIRLGPITLIANLSSAVDAAEGTGLRMVCPEHKCFVHQQLMCDDGDHEVSRESSLRGAETSEGLRIVNPAELPIFEASETFDIVAVPSADIDTHTAPDTSVFYVLPKPKTGSDEAWLVLYDLVQSRDTAYVVTGAIRKGKKSLWRLTTFNGYMALRQLKFPSQVREAPPIPTSDTAKATLNSFKKLAKEFSAKSMVEWGNINSTDEYKDRLAEFVAQGELVEAPARTKESAAATQGSSAVDVMEALKEALGGIK